MADIDDTKWQKIITSTDAKNGSKQKRIRMKKSKNDKSNKGFDKNIYSLNNKDDYSDDEHEQNDQTAVKKDKQAKKEQQPVEEKKQEQKKEKQPKKDQQSVGEKKQKTQQNEKKKPIQVAKNKFEMQGEDDQENDSDLDFLNKEITGKKADFSGIQEKLKKKKDQFLKNTLKLKSKFWENIILILVVVGFFLVIGYMKKQEDMYNKYSRNNQDSSNLKDLYEVLQIDQSASAADIKNQFKKLAVIWHPDKNPNCGEKCEKKFQEISVAYEMLGNAEKRAAYDQNKGIYTPITSKAVALTEQNFERLVEDSKDLWIIQIFEDGNEDCEAIAPFWEALIEHYSGSGIKFGRINLERQFRLRDRLPVNIVIVPTFLSMQQGHETQFWIQDENNAQISMRKFVDSCIEDKLKIETLDSFKKFQSQKGQKIQENSNTKIQIFTLSSASKPSSFLKYNAYKFSDFFDIHINKAGQFLQIEKHLEKQTNSIIFYNDNNKLVRKSAEFNFKNIKQSDFKNLLSLGKFLTVPDIDKNNFAELCQNYETRVQLQDEASTEPENQQTLCVLIVKPKKSEKQSIIMEQIQDFQDLHENQIIENIKNRQGIFQKYHSFQIAWIDLDSQIKFKKMLKNLERQYEDVNVDKAVAFGILAENKKVTVLDNINQLEDWIEDLLEGGDKQEFFYLQNYIGDDELQHYLYPKNYSLPFVIIKFFIKHFKDWKMIFTTFGLIIFLGFLGFLQSKTDGLIKGFIFHSIFGLILVMLQLKDELFH